MHIYFLVCVGSESEHYEGLPLPGCNPIKRKKKKKKQELISYLSKMLHFLSSLRTHSQHYQSFDYPEKKWIQNSSSSSLERPDLHIENAIEGCLICICLSFGNN